MAHFINKQNQYVITTSYKVGYSTLRANSHLTKISDKILKKVPNSFSHYMILREPFKRTESLYKDRFLRLLKEDNLETKLHQKIMRYFDMDRDVFKAFLEQLDFETFVMKVLPKIMHLDPHTKPQNESRKRFVHKKIKFIYSYYNLEYFKIENKFQMDRLGELTNVDFSVKVNSSNNNIQLKWTEDMRKIIKKFYRKDFQLYNKVK